MSITLPNSDNGYQEFFDRPDIKKELETVTTFLQTLDKDKLFPSVNNIFKALELTPLQDIKVVILGQDPYHTPGLATGLSFSVPHGYKLPPSLLNIFNNMVKFNHYKEVPKSGSLDHWAQQGCLMLNTALTVLQSSPNCHAKKWEKITDALIKYISDKCEYVIFVLWGTNALNKLNLIDISKHITSISSHPSGLSYKRPLGIYPEFADCDHFGKINKHLTNIKKTPIIW